MLIYYVHWQNTSIVKTTESMYIPIHHSLGLDDTIMRTNTKPKVHPLVGRLKGSSRLKDLRRTFIPLSLT